MTLVEILLALAILAVIAAVVYPTAAGQLRQGHSSALGNQLSNLRTAIQSYRDNVGAYPNNLQLLTTQPVNGDDDSCGANLSAAERNAWRGPYINQVVGAPMPVGNALIQLALGRAPATTSPAVLQISTQAVENDIALDLEARFDGNANLAAGTILWNTANGGTLTFQIPIGSC
jgi:general secretion pathway protein G